jgi:competence protein ComEC
VASVVTLPLVLWTFGRVSLVAPLTNIVAGPVVAVLQPALFLALLCAPLPPVARFVADAAHPLLAALDGVAVAGASLPHATLWITPTLAAAWACGIASAAFVVACVTRHPGLPIVVCAGAAALLAWLPLLPSRAGNAELHMIDVGQGDALALRTPRGRWILFDAGRSWNGGDAGRTAVIPYLRRYGGDVVAFVLSHPHADHVGGAASVLRALRPRQYWDAAFAGGSESYRGSLEVARAMGTDWRRVRPGDSMSVDGVRVRFLAPDSAWTVTLRDPNEASTVALISYGAVRFLLVGDAERAEEGWLVRHAGGNLRADVLKVGHHGSSTSSSAAFLDAVRPRLALVSAGLGNSYGHPSPDVLQALADGGAEVVRTDLVGSAIVRTDGRRITVLANGVEWPLTGESSGFSRHSSESR